MASSFFKPQAQTAKSTQKHVVDPSLQPWVEKYRPKTIDDVSAQEHTVAVLRKTLTSTNLPHMLFYGPPGTGKTSTILALARQLFGPDNFRSRVLELNASDERGISIVRDKIKNFARQTPRAQAVSSDDKVYPCPPYKIIILDEADSMTQDAQGRFRFTPLDHSSSSTRIAHIASQEGIQIDAPVVDALITTSSGDLRRAITYLQSAHRLSSSTQPPTQITPRDIQEIAGVVPDGVINDFVQSLGIDMDTGMQVDILGKASFDRIRNKVREIIREGYSAMQILSQVHDIVALHPTLNAKQKSNCALIFAEADKALCDGADEELWILEVGLRVHKALA
ncbi:P-loop containing nucleoside triphosphate hydrolase protein [Gymnopus androsaceus JB14]|uniref:P-loop containing nucleoside triphosphate hydrolase protein n=1 Tax=Gymnopus androsaceus JB14 TaxID=1447944 RepID=A0A6A4I3K3_9AGAR|nr:P-loop containing nucleoside triphosphate hydrolase protein [Gymnopus androsaceus JB14]